MSFLTRFAMVFLTLTAVFTSTQALAHAHLTTAEPAQQSQLSTSPERLTLHFTEDLEPAFSRIELLSPAGKAIATGKASVGKTEKSTLTVPVSNPLTQGEYRVNWHVVSVDGHATSGSYTFSIK